MHGVRAHVCGGLVRGEGRRPLPGTLREDTVQVRLFTHDVGHPLAEGTRVLQFLPRE